MCPRSVFGWVGRKREEESKCVIHACVLTYFVQHSLARFSLCPSRPSSRLARFFPTQASKQANKAAYCTLLLQIDVVAKLGVELGLESVHALLDVLELALEGHEVLIDLLLSCAEASTWLERPNRIESE